MEAWICWVIAPTGRNSCVWWAGAQRVRVYDNRVCRSAISPARRSGLPDTTRAIMGASVGEVVVCVAVPERAKVLRNLRGANLEEFQKFHEPIFDRSQDAPLKGLGRPAFRHVPTHRQPVGELALRFLVASFAAPSDGPNIERTAATARSGRSVHTMPAFRFRWLIEQGDLSSVLHSTPRAYGP